MSVDEYKKENREKILVYPPPQPQPPPPAPQACPPAAASAGAFCVGCCAPASAGDATVARATTDVADVGCVTINAMATAVMQTISPIPKSAQGFVLFSMFSLHFVVFSSPAAGPGDSSSLRDSSSGPRPFCAMLCVSSSCRSVLQAGAVVSLLLLGFYECCMQ
jgi:hypothetical protein